MLGKLSKSKSKNIWHFLQQQLPMWLVMTGHIWVKWPVMTGPLLVKWPVRWQFVTSLEVVCDKSHARKMTGRGEVCQSTDRTTERLRLLLLLQKASIRKTSEKRLKVAIWATDERLMSNWWATGEQLVSDWWVTGERLVSNWWATGERLVSDWWATVERLTYG